MNTLINEVLGVRGTDCDECEFCDSFTNKDVTDHGWGDHV